jgi:hypothetical protein
MHLPSSREKQAATCSNQRAAMAGFCATVLSALGLRRWPRAHGMAGVWASELAMMDLSQRRCGFMAMVLVRHAAVFPRWG